METAPHPPRACAPGYQTTPRWSSRCCWASVWGSSLRSRWGGFVLLAWGVLRALLAILGLLW